MTRKRVEAAADLRGMSFDGIKAFRNVTVGTAYEILTPNGFIQSDTLEGLYKMIMKFPILPGTVLYVNYDTGKIRFRRYK